MKLSDALKSDNCKFTTLCINRNGLTDEGAKYLSDALAEERLLQTYYLRHKSHYYLLKIIQEF